MIRLRETTEQPDRLTAGMRVLSPVRGTVVTAGRWWCTVRCDTRNHNHRIARDELVLDELRDVLIRCRCGEWRVTDRCTACGSERTP